MRMTEHINPIPIPKRPFMKPASSENQSYKEWLIQAVQEGIAEAERGELIPFEDINKYWENYFEDVTH